MSLLIGNKRSHGGLTYGRNYIRFDKNERHDLIINYYTKGEHSEYIAEHFSFSISNGHGIIQKRIY